MISNNKTNDNTYMLLIFVFPFIYANCFLGNSTSATLLQRVIGTWRGEFGR